VGLPLSCETYCQGMARGTLRVESIRSLVAMATSCILLVRFSISSRVLLGDASTLDRNQEYLLCVFLDKLPSCQLTRETLVRKRCQRFWKAFPTVKVADTLLINGAVFYRNGNPRSVHSSALVARYKDTVLIRRVTYSGR
jgi:hypothetical protein